MKDSKGNTLVKGKSYAVTYPTEVYKTETGDFTRTGKFMITFTGLGSGFLFANGAYLPLSKAKKIDPVL